MRGSLGRRQGLRRQLFQRHEKFNSRDLPTRRGTLQVLIQHAQRCSQYLGKDGRMRYANGAPRRFLSVHPAHPPMGILPVTVMQAGKVMQFP